MVLLLCLLAVDGLSAVLERAAKDKNPVVLVKEAVRASRLMKEIAKRTGGRRGLL